MSESSTPVLRSPGKGRTISVVGDVYRFLATGAETNGKYALWEAIVPPGGGPPPHVHSREEEGFYILEGEITEIRVNTISNDYDLANPQEQLMTVVVNFVWKDLRSGQILVDRREFEQTAAYYPTLGEGEFAGSQQAVERLALGIVQELQADW